MKSTKTERKKMKIETTNIATVRKFNQFLASTGHLLASTGFEGGEDAAMWCSAWGKANVASTMEEAEMARLIDEEYLAEVDLISSELIGESKSHLYNF